MDKLAAFLYVKGLIKEDAPIDEVLALSSKVSASVEYLIEELTGLDDDDSEEAVQSVFYEAGKLHFLEDLRFWFKIIYQMLLSQMDGPRLGQFTKIMTIDWVSHRLMRSIRDHWQIVPVDPP